MSNYLPTISWGAVAKNIAVHYDSGVFMLNEYTIDVYPLDINEPGASTLECNVDDYFIDFLGWPWIVKDITALTEGIRIRLCDVNERSISEQVNYGPYPNKIGYVYRPTNGKIIFSQAQLLKLDSQARDRIHNIEKGIDAGGDMNWRGEWTGVNTPYSENDVVTDGAWTMIANSDTSNRPLPYVNPETYGPGHYDGVDTTFAVDQVFFGNRYLFQDKDLILNIIEFKLPAAANWMYYDFYTVIDPLYSNKITFLKRIYPSAETLGTTVDVEFDDLVIPKNTTFDIIAQGARYGGTGQDDGKTTEEFSYNYSHSNADPAPGVINHSLNGRTILVNSKDLDNLDFISTEIVQSVTINNGIENFKYNVLSRHQKSADVWELQVDPVYKISEASDCVVYVVYLSSYVGGIECNYLDRTGLETPYDGLYTEGNLSDIAIVEAYFGIAIAYNYIVIDDNWDVVAASSSSISISSGAGSFPKDSEVDLVADIQATIDVGGVSVGDLFDPNNSVRDLLKAIIAPYQQPLFTKIIVYPFNNGNNSGVFEVGFSEEVASMNISSSVDTLSSYPNNCLVNPSQPEFPNTFSITQSPQSLVAVPGEIKGRTTPGLITWTLTGLDSETNPIPNGSFSAYWRYRWCFGGNPTIVTDDTSAQTVIDALQDTELTSGKSNIVTCQSYNNDGSNFTYICYDSSYGDLTKIIQDGALPVLTAFSNLGDFSFTNQNGVVSTYKVYKSNATGAFAVNAELNIS